MDKLVILILVVLAIVILLGLWHLLDAMRWQRELAEAKTLLDRTWKAYQDGTGSREAWRIAIEHSKWVRTRGKEGRPYDRPT